MGELVSYRQGKRRISRRRAIVTIVGTTAGLATGAVGAYALAEAHSRSQQEVFQSAISEFAETVRNNLNEPPNPNQKRWDRVKVTAAAIDMPTRVAKELAQEPVDARPYPASYLHGLAVPIYNVPLGTFIENVVEVQGTQPYSQNNPAKYGAFLFKSVKGPIFDRKGNQVHLQPKDVLAIHLDNLHNQSPPAPPMGK